MKLVKYVLAALVIATGCYAAEINDLDTTDDNNTGRWPEGMPFANVNDAGRALEGILARADKDRNGSLTTAGSSNTYTLATNQTLTAYYTGLSVRAKANFTSTGAATLNVDGLGAKTITGSAAGSIVSGAVYDWVYDGTNFVQLSAVAIDIPSGTKSLFVQSGCPTGWTQDTTHNNKALRLVSGTGAGTGGSTGFTSVLTSRTPTGTVGGTTLTVNQIPNHGHPVRIGDNASGATTSTGGFALQNSDENYAAFTGTPTATVGEQIGGTGGGQSHDHSWTGNAMDFAVLFVDVIICTKN